MINFVKSNSNSKSDYEVSSLIACLKKVNLFQSNSGITESDLYKICIKLKYEFYKKGEVVFEINSAGNKFYIILKGAVSIWIPRRSSISIPLTNNLVEAKELHSGDSFGELSLITQKGK